MLTNFNAPVITDYSPISAKGGRRRTRRRHRSRRHKRRGGRTRKHR